MHQHACAENFLAEGAKWGLGKRDIVSNINFFMNVPVEADGTLGIVDGLSAPGKSLTLRAEHGHPGAGVELPADQQPLQRLRPDAGPDGDHGGRRCMTADRGAAARAC